MGRGGVGEGAVTHASTSDQAVLCFLAAGWPENGVRKRHPCTNIQSE